MTFVFLNSDLYSTQYYIEGPDNLLTILTIIMLNTNVSFLMNFRSPSSQSRDFSTFLGRGPRAFYFGKFSAF